VLRVRAIAQPICSHIGQIALTDCRGRIHRRLAYKKLSQTFAIYARMGKKEDERLRETVLAELKRRRKAAHGEGNRPAGQSGRNSEEASKPGTR
jgi:hypothetical protein